MKVSVVTGYWTKACFIGLAALGQLGCGGGDDLSDGELGTMSSALLLSQGKTVTVSSSANGNVGTNAVDGNTVTRWESLAADPQWITVDLGSSQAVNRVVLNWEAAYSSSYQIRTSTTGADCGTGTWTTIYSDTAGNGGVDDFTVNGSGRYVCMYSLTRGTGWGVSLFEFQVHGPDSTGTLTRFEAEASTYTGAALGTDAPTKASASGGNFIDGNAAANLTWTVNSPGGSQALKFATTSPSGVRLLGAFVNGTKVGVVTTTTVRPAWAVQTVTATLNAGNNTIELRDSEATTEPDIDYLEANVAGGPICTPTTCAAQGKNCGSISDGCDNTLTCGTCGTGQTCTANVCTASSTCLSNDLTTATNLTTSASTGTASGAFDNNVATRWESAAADPQWVQVDLGASKFVNRVRLDWEAANAKDYSVRISNDATFATYTTLVTKTNMATGEHRIDDLTGLSGSGRYVRIHGTVRNTGYGYSIWEMDVYGDNNASCGGGGGGCTTNAQCSDGNACNGAEICNAGSCQAGTALTCNDNNACTSDSCNPASGCVYANNTNACADDGSSCTNDVCSAGACTHPSNGSCGGGGGSCFTIRSQRTNNYLFNNAGLVTPGATLASAEIFEKIPSGNGFQFKARSNNQFVGVTGNNLAVNNTAVTFTEQDCSSGGTYPNGKGYASPSGTGPYWKANSTTGAVNTNNGGNGGSCVSGGATAWERFYLESATCPGGGGGGGCGNGSCQDGETCSSCSQDCGPCGHANVPVSDTCTSGYLTLTANPASLASSGTAADAFDNNSGTRWTSTAGVDPQWLQVDLGASKAVNRVRIHWEGANAKDYSVRISNDVNFGTYTTLVTKTNMATGNRLDDLTGLSGTGRYVRVHGTARNLAEWGYSIFEMDVFNGSCSTSVVDVVGSQGNWNLTVDGQNYTVKGFTWGGTMPDANAYMPLFTAMGANTTRTWGTGPDTAPLLDAAAAHDVRVIMGFWLVPGGGPGSGGCLDYSVNTPGSPEQNYKDAVMTDILAAVQMYKNHPAVLMWNIGNESNLGFGACYTEPKLGQVRTAYAQYVNQVSVAIHAIDANHPTTNTDAWVQAWPYLKAHAPDLDLMSINSYGDVEGIRTHWEAGGYTKPYILTEGGNDGEWEVPDDVNGVPSEQTDSQKTDAYTSSWKTLMGHQGVALGATMFHFDTKGDFGGVWFNVIPNGMRRGSYFSMSRAWGVNTSAMNISPVISSMSITNSTAIPSGQTFTVTVNATDPDGDTLAHSFHLNSNYINGSWNTAPAEVVSQSGNTWTLRVPAAFNALGVWKLYDFVTDGAGNIAVDSRSFNVTCPTGAACTNVALGKTATASTVYPWDADYNAVKAIDGDPAKTRWTSYDLVSPDDEWIQVDLGSVQTIRYIQLQWEAAFGANYQIQTSNDGTNWTTIQSIVGGDGGIDHFAVSGTGRYVRMNGTLRGTPYGYSLYEFQIFQ